MRLALLRKPLPGRRLAHWAGTLLDHGPYSHGELVFSDRMTGSSWLNGGVQLRRMRDEYYLGDPEQWHFFTLPPGLEPEARKWFEANRGAPYDILGPCRFAIGAIRHSAHAYYCHEAIAAALQLTDPWRYTGGQFICTIKDHWKGIRTLSPWYSPPYMVHT